MLCVRLFGLAADCPAAQDRPDRERTRIRMLVMLTQVLAADGEADRIDPRKFERIWNVVSPIPDDRTQGVEEPLACLLVHHEPLPLSAKLSVRVGRRYD